MNKDLILEEKSLIDYLDDIKAYLDYDGNKDDDSKKDDVRKLAIRSWLELDSRILKLKDCALLQAGPLGLCPVGKRKAPKA